MSNEKAPKSGAFLPASLMHFCSGKSMHFCSDVDSVTMTRQKAVGFVTKRPQNLLPVNDLAGVAGRLDNSRGRKDRTS
jgi:hypothetical protein